MSGTTPSGASAPRMTLDRLAQQLSPRMVVYEAVCVGLVALSMFVLWDGPGSPWGTVIVLAVSFVVIGRVWIMPSRELPRVPSESATDPNRAAEEMSVLANKTMKTLMVPTVVGFAATLVSWGWNPVFAGALVTIAGFTFFGPSRTKLASWQIRMEEAGGKTGL
ncbi:MAG TPA: hypothetical protein VFR23_23930 [Jiangellaceae bacterium]|nr:hypothetical protein [Jiangellaceae bacterium]